MDSIHRIREALRYGAPTTADLSMLAIRILAIVPIAGIAIGAFLAMEPSAWQ